MKLAEICKLFWYVDLSNLTPEIETYYKLRGMESATLNQDNFWIIYPKLSKLAVSTPIFSGPHTQQARTA